MIWMKHSKNCKINFLLLSNEILIRLFLFQQPRRLINQLIKKESIKKTKKLSDVLDGKTPDIANDETATKDEATASIPKEDKSDEEVSLLDYIIIRIKS